MDYNLILNKLAKSKFRSSFHLRKYMINYINDKGINTIREHAYDFVTKRLAPMNIKNDGKQTPMKGHPVFIAQHACACCCRSCLEKWYRIPKNTKLNSKQIEHIINILMKWIELELKNNTT